MRYNHYWTRLKRYHQRLLGSTVVFDLAHYQAMVADIQNHRERTAALSDEQLQSASHALRLRAESGECLDTLLVPAFVLVNEAIWRTLHLRAYPVQLIAGIAMHQGRLAEMQTGEGKTLAAVFPAYLNALTGTGVHVLTFNDYLARRDAQWMGPVYEFLDMRVACVLEGMGTADRQHAYAADITYLTAKEAGFDFLRDSLCRRASGIVLRPLNFAIIDEADSILIDESRVPLVIAGAADHYGDQSPSSDESLAAIARIARGLQSGIHFDFDEYQRNVFLTEAGINLVEKELNCPNIYDDQHAVQLVRLGYALHAQHLLHIDKDYIVRNGSVELVDEFTGRVAARRRWPAGLHEALEAKEAVPVRSSGIILNSITLQHFILQYPKRSGMTATAQPAEQEFRECYGLHTVVIPPNRPCVRRDSPDLVFATREAKLDALCLEIAEVNRSRRPILVGTRTVAESAELAERLTKQGVQCQVLNARNDDLEADIIARTGRLGAVTISTNMAGRGTDIRLGGGDPKQETAVKALGGLYVIGTNRHESLRIDHQLRGRAGRQGDPGSSRFFVSLEDDLFVKYRVGDLLPASVVRAKSGVAIENPVVQGEVNRLQRIIEGQHAESKTMLCKYSLLLEQQRQLLHAKRDALLRGRASLDLLASSSSEHLAELTRQLGDVRLLATCRELALFHLDRLWSHHLSEVSTIRDCIHLRKYGQQDPLSEFNKVVISLFDTLVEEFERETARSLQAIRVSGDSIDLCDTGARSPSATWTYLVSDNPSEDPFRLTNDMGHSVFVGLLWPLAIVFLVIKAVAGKKRRAGG